jgi:hypothetical protein
MVQDTLEKAAGEKLTLKLGGREYVIRQFRLSDYQALRERMKSQRIKEFLAGAGEVAPAERVQVLKHLASEPISDREMMTEASSMAGMMFLLWRQLRQQDPAISLDNMDSLLGEAELTNALAALEGVNAPDAGDKAAPLAGTAGGSTSPSAS